jgi:hypothetical protein
LLLLLSLTALLLVHVGSKRQAATDIACHLFHGHLVDDHLEFTEAMWNMKLAGVTYGPCVVPSTDEFTEVMWNRKLDAVGKNPSKHPKAVRKKKADVVKIAPSRGKASLKRLSATEVASARPLKQSKRTMAHPVAAVTATRVPTGVLSSKVNASASGSKGAVDAKKTAMPVRKHHVRTIGAMAAASLEESQESSPHG